MDVDADKCGYSLMYIEIHIYTYVHVINYLVILQGCMDEEFGSKVRWRFVQAVIPQQYGI